MKKALVLICLSLFLTGFVSISQAHEVTLKALEGGKWAILDAGGQEIGTLAKVDEGGYSILPKGGQYLGVVKSNGDLQLLVRHATVSPSEVQLYLDVLEAIKTLK
ncbi:MAG: hypothetical protein ABSF52_05265 [Syntrophobacteraceae bacterium]|jgi:hypothetical protein